MRAVFRLIQTLAAALMLMAFVAPLAQAEVLLKIGMLNVTSDAPLPISRLDLPPDDLGIAGAETGLKDNNTTGQFLNQKYELVTVETAPDGIEETLGALREQGVAGLVVRADADNLLAIADAPEAEGMLILNATALDDRLRNDACRANVLHVAPSRAMLTDGLAQYMVWKKWTDWVLVYGSHPVDTLKADAYRRSAKKFGIKIVDERLFEDTGGARRSDSGHVLVQRQIPVFMQELDDHDVVVAADESEVFGVYLPYRTWDARPVVGDAGLVARTWHPSHEGWGATQVQRRFEKAHGRGMRDEDYQVWAAIRIIGEAVTRTNSADAETLRSYILSDEFEVAAFKGQALSFRSWNNQLRQGIILADGQLVVTVSPQEEFLHQRTRLDTLGFDEPESTCKF
jgi:ABC transporter substrate binding protein (PQQ-dependent alcohol dehydrogenase system)